MSGEQAATLARGGARRARRRATGALEELGAVLIPTGKTVRSALLATHPEINIIR